MKSALPTLDAVRATATRISPYIVRTPVMPYAGSQLLPLLPQDCNLWLKYELLQRTGSFKPRGALNVLLNMSDAERRAGVTAFSAGNHAIATAYAASILGVSAKLAMPATANPFRVRRCNELGAEVVFGEDINDLLMLVGKMQHEEGRSLVHPFEGEYTSLGTATIGLEICEDGPTPDAVVVPIGGGGLISGIATAVKLQSPHTRVIGVEPEGAAGITQSLAAGEPLPRVQVNTIADSLGAPCHEQYSFSLIREYVDEVVTVPDDALRNMMHVMFTDLKLAVEPACAAALAAITGPLRDELSGAVVTAVLCGSNLDIPTFNKLVRPSDTG